MGATLSLNSSWLLFDRTSCDNTTEKIKRHGRAHLIHQHGMNEQWHVLFFFFFSFIARNFSTLFISIFQVRDDGANGTHGFAMVLSVIALNEDPSDLSRFSLDGVCRGFDFLHGSTALPPISWPLDLSQPLNLSTS
jgi:hypothetical protein